MNPSPYPIAVVAIMGAGAIWLLIRVAMVAIFLARPKVPKATARRRRR